MRVGTNRTQLSFKRAELWPILSQILLPWQRGESGVNINDTVKLTDSENHTVEQKLRLHHRLNGNSGPVLTATSLSYGEAINSTPHRIKSPEPIEIKFGTVNYIGEGTRHAKFYANPSKRASEQIGELYAKIFIYICPFFFNAPTSQTF